MQEENYKGVNMINLDDYEEFKDDKEIIDIIKDFKADIVINDILNTDVEYVKSLKSVGVRVVNFEDEGEGAQYADAVINALYEKDNPERNTFYGSDYYLIRDEFVINSSNRRFSNHVNNILILFGGTDPCNLTNKTVYALLKLSNVHITVILGLGYNYYDEVVKLTENHDNFEIVQNVKMMSEFMGKADIAISSQGRTMLELAAMGVPTIIMSENEREATHEFGTIKNGYLNLGSGLEVSENTIYETINWLIQCPQIRRNMSQQMLEKDLLHGYDRVKKIVLGQQ